MLWLWSGPPESSCQFSLLKHFNYFLQSNPHRCFIYVFVYSVDFYVLGDVALMSYKPFTWIEQISCVYHGRTKGASCGHVKSI